MRNLAETLITAAKVAWVGMPTDKEMVEVGKYYLPIQTHGMGIAELLSPLAEKMGEKKTIVLAPRFGEAPIVSFNQDEQRPDKFYLQFGQVKRLVFSKTDELLKFEGVEFSRKNKGWWKADLKTTLKEAKVAHLEILAIGPNISKATNRLL